MGRVTTEHKNISGLYLKLPAKLMTILIQANVTFYYYIQISLDEIKSVITFTKHASSL